MIRPALLALLLLAGCGPMTPQPGPASDDDLQPDHGAPPASEYQYHFLCTCECWVRPNSPLCDCDSQTDERREQADRFCPARGYSKETPHVDP